MIREAEEKMCIYLSQKPNEHLLILGQSGTGKTYFCVRRIEEAIRNNKQIVIFDYSGSFTMHELQQARFAYCREVKYKNPIENGLMWNCSVDNYVATLSNAFIKHISPTLGRYYLTEIQQYQIKELIKNMKDNDLGYEMQNQTKILLVDMFDKAMVNEFVRKNPAKGISVKRDEKKEPRVLSVEEQYDFFECSKGTFYDNFFNVAVTTGMRLGEIAALTWDDIDLERRIISVTKTLVYIKYEGDLGKTFHMETPKTRTSVREIPINKQCELALKKQYAQKKVIESKAPVSKKPKEEFQNLLFTTKFNTPLNSQIIIDAIHKIVLTINETRYYIEEMEDFSCHCFRHTFATRCFEAGIQPKTVQKYLGHATLQMTMDLYTAVMPKHLSSEMEKLDDELEKISQSGEKLIDSRYKKEKQNDVITFPGNTLVV